MVERLVHTEENSKRIAQVENCFGISGVNLNVPGRALIGEGVLIKICRKKPKPRQFYLFNDILVYGTILINKKKFTQQRIILLEDITLENIPNDGDLENGWLIKTSTKSFVVYAGSYEEKTKWVGHIQKCISDLLQQTGKSAIQQHAAVWVPDSIASKCMHCKQTVFTLINRKHHCRNCGAVICGNCSKNRLVILYQSYKPVRVCDTCFDQCNNHLYKIKQSAELQYNINSNESDENINLKETDSNQNFDLSTSKSDLDNSSINILNNANKEILSKNTLINENEESKKLDSSSESEKKQSNSDFDDNKELYNNNQTSESEEEINQSNNYEANVLDEFTHDERRTTFYEDMNLEDYDLQALTNIKSKTSEQENRKRND